jgi:Protein-tyrosine phosphatase
LQFWPNQNETIENEYYRLQLSTEGDDEEYDYVIKRFTILSIQDGVEINVRMLYNPNWPNLNNPTCLYDFLIKMHERCNDYRNGPIVVMDRYGGTEAATLCVISSLAHQLEYYKTANIYMYAKLFHNKRPGIWTSSSDLSIIYKILAAFPTSNFELLKFTALKTEFDDSLVTATPDLYSKTPDLFSKICSNGNISNHFSNGNGNSMIVKMKTDGESGDLSAVVVTSSDTSDNLMLTK